MPTLREGEPRRPPIAGHEPRTRWQSVRAIVARRPPRARPVESAERIIMFVWTPERMKRGLRSSLRPRLRKLLRFSLRRQPVPPRSILRANHLNFWPEDGGDFQSNPNPSAGRTRWQSVRAIHEDHGLSERNHHGARNEPTAVCAGISVSRKIQNPAPL